MSEKNFGGGLENFQGIQSHSGISEGGFDAGKIHAGIPGIKTPGPKIGPDFSDMEKLEKEKNREKLEKIKTIILEMDIDLISPARTYKLLAEDLESKGLFGDEFKPDVNLFFNQKLVYLYNKEGVKSGHSEATEEVMKKKTEAAFAGAKSMHDTIEKLEKIEESGGNDEEIKKYWDAKETFFLGLMEKDTKELHDKEKMLLENLLNAQKYGALAEKAARDLIKNSSSYIKESMDKEGSIGNPRADGPVVNIKEASIKDDVYGAIDFYVEVILNGESEFFPVQVKCGNIDVRHGEDEQTQKYIMENLVRVVGDEDGFRCDKDDCYYKKKTTVKLNKFVKKALANNGYRKGFYLILPRGKEMLKENGEVDESIKKMFIEQFTAKVLDLI